MTRAASFFERCMSRAIWIKRSHTARRWIGDSMTPRSGRRTFASALAACFAFAALSIPCVSDAQQTASHRRIGVLLVGRSPESEEVLDFRQSLRDAGYQEGRDVVIEWRSTEGDYDRLPQLAAEIVQSKPDVILAVTTRGARAVKQATSSIPIVMMVGDPVESGLVASLAHPGGNVTGVSTMGTSDLWAKRLQLLKETIPRLTRVAVLWNPGNPLTPWQAKTMQDLKAAAPSLSLELSFVTVETPVEIGQALTDVRRARAQALCVFADAQLSTYREALLRLGSETGLPAMYSERRFVDDGGLMSYGANRMDQWRRAAAYVDKILKGAKPGDLPIEQPTTFEFVINLKTAKAIGLAIPQSVLLQANDVIR